MTWDELLSQLDGAPVQLVRSKHHPDHKGLHMAHKPLPVSISEDEFNYLHDFVIAHRLTRGFDLATGLGISALAMGLGMKANRGRVYTMDSFLEEHKQEQPIGDFAQDLLLNGSDHLQSDGYRMADWFNGAFDVEILCWRGRSPDDIEQNFHGEKFDCVMLDCPKCDADLERDLNALKPHLADKYAMFIHDSHTMPHGAEIVKRILGRDWVNVLPDQRFPFMLVNAL